MPKPNRRKFNRKREKPEFDQQILDLARVTRVTKGGKALSFRACVVLGNHKGRVGFGVAKGKDVQIAVDKSVRQAKKNMIEVPVVKDTVPHPITLKYKASTVFLKPAPKGSGIIAGGPVRALLELAGVPNVSAKIMGKTKNKISIVKAVFEALQSFKEEATDIADKEKEARQQKETKQKETQMKKNNNNRKKQFKKPFKEEVKKTSKEK